jgi:hypothetical protein
MERDGVEFRKVGSAMVACCPLHQEKTPSLHVHESSDGGWFKCFGCDAKGDALSYLNLRYGLDPKAAVEWMIGSSALHSLTPIPVPVVIREEAEPAKPVEDLSQWMKDCGELPVERWAGWRGIRPEVFAWAADKNLCGESIYMGEAREAFAIRRNDGAHMGEHIRLAPQSRGNNSSKASWRYRPKGIGSWPFAVVPSGESKYVFVTEGQWDALALIDAMGWEKSWPDGVAVFGLRGATSWSKMMEYEFSNRSIFFLIADRDAAGEKWFYGEDSFSLRLEERGYKVYGFFPAADGLKDLNDCVRMMDEAARDEFRKSMRSKIPPTPRPIRPTYRKWLSSQKSRTDAIGELASKVKNGEGPKGRAPKWKWMGFAQQSEWNMVAFQKSWEEYAKL